MTYAYLKKYSHSTDKRGFYLDGPNWTLQTSPRADRFFRQSTRYHDDTQLPLTVVKTLVYLGEAETGDRTPKDEILSWFPRLNPNYCDMDADQLEELRELIIDCVKSEKPDGDEYNEVIDFLQAETPIDVSFAK